MSDFGSSHADLLVTRPWLAPMQSDTGYMLKFALSEELKCCCAMITDSRAVWAEVLPFSSLVRRWLESNPELRVPLDPDGRPNNTTHQHIANILSLMFSVKHSSAGTLKVMEDYNSDLSIIVSTGDYSFRWNALSVGLRTAADLISSHLITPLLTFSWASIDLKEGMKQITGDALEKHLRPRSVQHRKTPHTLPQTAFRKPKLASALALIGATFNSRQDLPSIVDDVDDDPELPEPIMLPAGARAVLDVKPGVFEASRARHELDVAMDTSSDGPPRSIAASTAASTVPPPEATGDDTETESSDYDGGPVGEAAAPPSKSGAGPASTSTKPSAVAPKATKDDSDSDFAPGPSVAATKAKPNAVASDTDSDGPPAPKKAKTILPTSDSDSDAGAPKPAPVARAGVRQPARRGRRF